MKKQLFILLLLVSGNVLAQRAAVKTNLLHDVATAPSLAAMRQMKKSAIRL